MVSFLDFLRPDTLLAMRDFLWLRERIQVVHDESLTAQAIAACEAEENGAISLEGKLIDGGEFTLRALDFRRMEFGTKPTGMPDATVAFSTVAQPIFHKNFDLVAESFRDYLSRNYTLYICSDSLKQTDRIRAIFEDREIISPSHPLNVPCMRVLPTIRCVSASLPTTSFSTVSINTT